MAQSSGNPRADSAGPLALDGISVIECGQGVSAAFAAKLLSLLGAQVIKVEPPQGDITRRRGPFPGDAVDPDRSGLFLYLNADKAGVVLDLKKPSDRELLGNLLAGADVLVHNVPPPERDEYGLDNHALSKANPALIATGISAFGDFGPYANYRAYDLTAIHSSGLGSLAPLGSPLPEMPPLKPPGQQAEFQGGLYAAAVIAAALFSRMKTGRGQAIEISEQEILAAALELSFIFYTYEGRQTSRLGTRALAPFGIYECGDGLVATNCAEEAMWDRLVELMGNPDWAHEEIFKDRLARGRHHDAMRLLLEEWARGWKKHELCAAAQAKRIPMAPVNVMADVYADEHLRSRGFFVPLPGAQSNSGGPVLMPSAPFKSTAMGWRLERRAPHLGEHADLLLRPRPAARSAQANDTPAQAGPLAGIRVLDFCWVWAGPYCTMQLAHLGAEVIRVESAKRPDINRCIPPFHERKPGLNRGGSFNQWNQGKRSIELDLSKPEAVEIAYELAAHCDVVTENYAPGAAARMGLSYERFKQVKPDIIMCSLSGYGQTGPLSRWVSYGALLGGQSGMVSLSGYAEDGIPRDPATSYGDPILGMFALLAINTALVHRARTGQGQYIDVSMYEAMEMIFPEALLEYAVNGREPKPMSNHDLLMSPHNCYKTLGGAEEWVSIAVGSEQEWQALCEAMGQPGLAKDPRFRTAELRKRNEAELDAIITQWTTPRDRWEITEQLQRAGVAAIPTLSNKDLAHDRHLRERGYLVELEHPEVGKRIHAGIPWTMSGTPCKIWRAAPLLGQDTDYLLSSLLGYSPEKIAELRGRKILY
ncbi:MAG: CaiB/BaiF CoA transferase family protein [Candidatus Binataceae bacterium]